MARLEKIRENLLGLPKWRHRAAVGPAKAARFGATVLALLFVAISLPCKGSAVTRVNKPLRVLTKCLGKFSNYFAIPSVFKGLPKAVLMQSREALDQHISHLAGIIDTDELTEIADYVSAHNLSWHLKPQTDVDWWISTNVFRLPPRPVLLKMSLLVLEKTLALEAVTLANQILHDSNVSHQQMRSKEYRDVQYLVRNIFEESMDLGISSLFVVYIDAIDSNPALRSWLFDSTSLDYQMARFFVFARNGLIVSPEPEKLIKIYNDWFKELRAKYVADPTRIDALAAIKRGSSQIREYLESVGLHHEAMKFTYEEKVFQVNVTGGLLEPQVSIPEQRGTGTILTHPLYSEPTSRKTVDFDRTKPLNSERR